MKPQRLSICAALLAISATFCVMGAPHTSSFDAVPAGSIVVYNVNDLTAGRQELSDQIATLLRDNCEPDACAAFGVGPLCERLRDS